MATKPYVDTAKAEAEKMARNREALKKETPKPEMSIPETIRDMKERKKQEAGEKAMGMRSGGYVKAADGCAQRGKTRGKMV